MIKLYFFLFGTTKRTMIVIMLFIITCALLLNPQGVASVINTVVWWILDHIFPIVPILLIILFISETSSRENRELD